MESRKVAGIRVDFGLKVPDVLAKIDEFVRAPGSHFLFTVNPEFVMKAQKDAELAWVLNSSHLSVPDGVGLLFARKYLDRISKMRRDFLFPLKAFVYGAWMGMSRLTDTRLSGSDLLYDICSHAEKNGYTIFLLGGWDKDKFGRMKSHHGNIAAKAVKKLKKDFPSLKIVGSSSDFSHGKDDDKKCLEYIGENMTKAGVEHIDILFVGFTAGKQEKWISRNVSKMPAKVGIGVGSSFDFTAGVYKRAPDMLKGRNLEWLFRLVNQPWRIKRIFISFPIFPLFVYFKSIQTLPENS